jgi:hypothetical protein
MAIVVVTPTMIARSARFTVHGPTTRKSRTDPCITRSTRLADAPPRRRASATMPAGPRRTIGASTNPATTMPSAMAMTWTAQEDVTSPRLRSWLSTGRSVGGGLGDQVTRHEDRGPAP